MELAVNLVYQGAGPLAQAAERLGYALALAPEGYRSDAPSLLGYVAGRTERIGLASAVMQMPGRPPGMAALTAATLHALSDGRFRLGLGVSNPDVADGWYGEPGDHPLARTREYVAVVRAALRGGPVEYSGSHIRLPASGACDAPLHLFTDPLPADLPIYLAAVGPRNLRLAGEVADGWIGVFASTAMVARAREAIAEGRRAAGRTMGGFEVMPCLATAVDDDPERAADQLRGQYLYLLGIGRPERNVYCRLMTGLGHGRAVAEVREHLAAGDRAGAAAAIPFDLIDDTALVGPVGRIAGKLARYEEAGVTTLGVMVSAAAVDLDGRLAILHALAEARAAAGAHRSASVVASAAE